MSGALGALVKSNSNMKFCNDSGDIKSSLLAHPRFQGLFLLLLAHYSSALFGIRKRGVGVIWTPLFFPCLPMHAMQKAAVAERH